MTVSLMEILTECVAWAQDDEVSGGAHETVHYERDRARARHVVSVSAVWNAMCRHDVAVSSYHIVLLQRIVIFADQTWL